METDFVAKIKSNIPRAELLKGITISDGELSITIEEVTKKEV